MVVPISQTYIDMIKAFRANCDSLMWQFKNKESKDLTTFLNLWHSLNFNLVYDMKYPRHGTQHDFMNDTLQIAKLIMLREDFSGGMFLMYGLYTLQDNAFFRGTIRLEFDEYCYILKILSLKDEAQDRAKKNNQQLAFIFSTLLKENAFDLVLYGREYDMEGQHRALIIYHCDYDYPDDENPKIVKPRAWLENLLEDLSDEEEDFENDYFKLKGKIKAVFPYLNLSLDVVQENIATTLLRTLTQEDSMAEPIEADTSIGAKRRALKNRKMKARKRYQIDESDEKFHRDEPPTKKRTIKKKGAPRGGRKFFFSQAINDPHLHASSDTEEDDFDFRGRPLKPELGLPILDFLY